MALITRQTKSGFDVGQGMKIPQLSGNLIAGEDLDHSAPCYIKASDKKVYMSNGTAANEAAKIDGFTADSYKTGETVTLFQEGARFKYGPDLVAGDELYLAATKGRLDSAATTGCNRVIARCYKDQHIYVLTLQGYISNLWP